MHNWVLLSAVAHWLYSGNVLDLSITDHPLCLQSACERPVDRSLDSDVSEHGGDHGSDVSMDKLDKLDAGDRDLYEKLRQQEKDERLEIERELKVHETVMSGLKRHNDMRIRDFRSSTEDLGQDLRVNKSEREKIEKFDREREDYKSLRENVLKGYTSPAINIYNHPAYLAAMASATAGYPRSQTPESTTSATPPLGDGPSHHWTFEEQFKQVRPLTCTLVTCDPTPISRPCFIPGLTN